MTNDSRNFCHFSTLSLLSHLLPIVLKRTLLPVSQYPWQPLTLLFPVFCPKTVVHASKIVRLEYRLKDHGCFSPARDRAKGAFALFLAFDVPIVPTLDRRFWVDKTLMTAGLQSKGRNYLNPLRISGYDDLRFSSSLLAIDIIIGLFLARFGGIFHLNLRTVLFGESCLLFG